MLLYAPVQCFGKPDKSVKMLVNSQLMPKVSIYSKRVYVFTCDISGGVLGGLHLYGPHYSISGESFPRRSCERSQRGLYTYRYPVLMPGIFSFDLRQQQTNLHSRWLTSISSYHSIHSTWDFRGKVQTSSSSSSWREKMSRATSTSAPTLSPQFCFNERLVRGTPGLR